MTARDTGSYVISTDSDDFDLDVFHRWISEQSYWANGRTRETTEAAVANSLVFGAYSSEGTMVGAARVVTDCATFGWLCDLFVIEGHRGNGLGRALVEAVVLHPCLYDTKRIILATGDAHGLYEQYGFKELGRPERWMEYNGSTR